MRLPARILLSLSISTVLMVGFRVVLGRLVDRSLVGLLGQMKERLRDMERADPRSPREREEDAWARDVFLEAREILEDLREQGKTPVPRAVNEDVRLWDDSDVASMRPYLAELSPFLEHLDAVRFSRRMPVGDDMPIQYLCRFWIAKGWQQSEHDPARALEGLYSALAISRPVFDERLLHAYLRTDALADAAAAVYHLGLRDGYSPEEALSALDPLLAEMQDDRWILYATYRDLENLHAMLSRPADRDDPWSWMVAPFARLALLEVGRAQLLALDLFQLEYPDFDHRRRAIHAQMDRRSSLKVFEGGCQLYGQWVEYQAWVRVIRLSLAARVHRQEAGEWPDRAEALESFFLEGRPLDPWTLGDFQFDVNRDALEIQANGGARDWVVH